MKENFSENYMIKRLEYINNKSLKHLNKIENNFNELKDAFYELTKLYDINKMNEQNSIIKEKNFDYEPLNKIVNQLMSEEHNNNINFIDSCLSKYNSNNCIPSVNEQMNTKNIIYKIESEIKQIISNLEEQVKNIKLEKTNNFQTINIEMNNEINNIIKKINDTSLDLIISNSDKANAIQDIINIYLNKFKVSKSEFDEFEDKITKLISELLDKVILLRKGQ